MTLRRVLFLSLGLWLVNPPDEKKFARTTLEKLQEPDGARACRRNIIALSSAIIITGLMGGNPHNVNVFGISPSGDQGVLVVGVASVMAHLYWYVQRYFYLKDDGKIEQDAHSNPTPSGYVKINWNTSLPLVQRQHNLFANRLAFVMTLTSWVFIALWIAEDHLTEHSKFADSFFL